VDVDNLLTRGASLLESGEFEKALECFNEGVKLRPDDLSLLSYRAAALLRLGRNQEALERIDDILGRQLASGQNLVHVYTGKANALVGLERYEEAVAYYQKALEIAAGDNNLWFMQGYAFYQLDEFDQALASFVKARELKDEFRTSLHIGNCLLMLKRYSEAAGEFSSLISEGSPDPQAFYGLGLAKYALGDKREARMHLERFIKMAGPEHEHLLPQARKILQQV